VADPERDVCVGPCSHQASKELGRRPREAQAVVVAIRKVSPGIDSPSATSSFSRPSAVCVQPTIVIGP